MVVSVAVEQDACFVPQWVNTRPSTGMTPITAAVVVECLGNSNCHLCTLGGRGTSSCAINGIQMVMVVSVVEVLLARYVPQPTTRPLTTEMTLTTEEVMQNEMGSVLQMN